MGHVSRPAVATLALAQLAFLVVSASLLVSLSRPDYHALGSAPAPAAGNAIVMFRAQATQKEVGDALGAAGASIVGGPTPAGAYLVHVDPGKRQAALARLQANRDVRLAQPVDGASP